MKLDARPCLLFAFTALAACSSSAAGVSDAGTESDSSVATDGGASLDTNPYGIAYPSARVGFTVRQGNTPGSVIPNVKLVGYLPGAAEVTSVSLAGLYDPEGRTHDVVAIMLCASWNAPSNDLMARLGERAPKRVATLAVLGESGAEGTAATVDSLATWRPKVPATVHNFLDPRWSQFGSFARTALPYVVLVDARTMEIVRAENGASQTPSADFEAAAAEVAARAPSF